MQKVHFIGIGGIGVSALARYYLGEGWVVSGSDQSDSQLIQDLISEGIKVFVGPHKVENVPLDVNKVIYTVAVKEDNLEFQEAKRLQNIFNLGYSLNVIDIILMTYPQALGEMTKSKKVIAVCGTHGKTTTTAMVYSMLKECGIDASMIVGSLIEIDGKKTNYVKGKNKVGELGDWIVIEACEYRQSFLNYFPDYTIITNIDADHLDFYKDLEDIKKSFGLFVDNIKVGENVAGKVIVHNSENYISEYSENLKQNKIQKINTDQFISEEEINQKIILNVPGLHNRQNASLVYSLGKILGFSEDKILQGLKNFKGTWRRQEYKGVIKVEEVEQPLKGPKNMGLTLLKKDIIFYDDYAHHPHEIKATLAAFREKYSDKKICIAFMPHLFSRTKSLFNDFVNELGQADKVFLMPIYKSREVFDPTVSSEMLASEINKLPPLLTPPPAGGGKVQAKSFENFEDLKNEILKLDDNYLVITMGAGNIDDLYKILQLQK